MTDTDGYRLAVFFTKAYTRIVNPTLPDLDPTLSAEIANRQSFRSDLPSSADGCGGRSPGLDAFDWAPGFDSQSHVEHDAAVRHAPNRIEVSLDHLRDLPQQQGEAQDQIAQCLSIKQSAAAVPVELGDDALGGVDQLVGLCVRCRQ
jgi:hypothetical protein